MAHILLVDDDRFFLEVCSDLLQGEGYVVHRATSGEEALDCVARGSYQLIISDVIMPGMGGLEFLSTVKSADPLVDVIMVTGNADIDTAISALKIGARDYVVKPLNHDEFRHIVANSLEQRRLFDENHELRNLLSLFQVGHAISNCIELEKLYPLITDFLARELGTERCLGFFNDEQDRFGLLESRGFGDLGQDLGELFFSRYLNEETNFSYASKYINNLSLVSAQLHHSLDLREALVLFIKSKHELRGCVALFNNPGCNLPTSINYNRFTFLLDQASRAFDNAMRYANLKNLIYIDELTGLFNYRYLDIALDREMKRVERYGASVSVLFLDLDLFKNVNDTYGHLVGSQVLKEVGLLLKKSVRDVDVVVRYGGDEYTVILSEIGCREVAMVAERIRSAIESQVFLRGEHDIRITASLGYACCPEDGVTKQELLDMADQAMYRGKASGKNRVFRATDAMAAQA